MPNGQDGWRHFVVAVRAPTVVTDDELRGYIAGALADHGGAFSEDDPLFGGVESIVWTEAETNGRGPKKGGR